MRAIDLLKANSSLEVGTTWELFNNLKQGGGYSKQFYSNISTAVQEDIKVTLSSYDYVVKVCRGG